MDWLSYCGLNDFDVNTINNANMNNKRKRDYQRNNLMNVDLDDDYESSWTKYVGIDRETREKLKQNQLSKIKEQINSTSKQNNDLYLKESQFKDLLTDEMIMKKIENLKSKKDSNKTNFATDLPIFSVESENVIHDNNDSTESDNNINTQKHYKIPNNKSLRVKIPEFKNIEIPISTTINCDIEKTIEKNKNKINDNSLNNIIQQNSNNNNLNGKDNNKKKDTFPLSAYRTIQISTQSPIQPNINNQFEKNKIFQVNSIPKIKTEKKNEYSNQKREREYNENLNIFHKDQPIIMNDINNFNVFQNNNSPITIYKGLTQTPSLFSNHSFLNNSLFKDELQHFKIENFTSLPNNDMSITNNEISETYLRNNLTSPVLNQNNINSNNNNNDGNNMSIVINNSDDNKNELNLQNNKNDKKENLELKKNNKLIISKKEGKIVIKSMANENEVNN